MDTPIIPNGTAVQAQGPDLSDLGRGVVISQLADLGPQWVLVRWERAGEWEEAISDLTVIEQVP